MSDSSPDSEISFCRFEYFTTALNLDNIALNNPVANSVFRHCSNHAIDIDGSNQVDIMNNLFIENLNSAVDLNYSTSSDNDFVNIEGNTFSDNDTALAILSNNQTLNMVLENNIFVSNGKPDVNGVYETNDGAMYDATLSGGIINCINRNNLFWDNHDDIILGAIPVGEYQVHDNPLFVHRSRSAMSDWIGAYETESWKSIPDGYYCAQRPGDASRRPFEFRTGQTIVDIEFPAENEPFGQYDIYLSIGAAQSDGFALDLTHDLYSRGIYAYGEFFQGMQTVAGPAWLMIDNNLSGSFNLPGHLYCVLTFDNGSTLEVYLPDVSIPAASILVLWIAADGSTYWASTTPTHIGGANLDSYNALHWRANNLAVSAYNERVWRAGLLPTDSRHLIAAPSPVVDAGSRDFLSNGTTIGRWSDVDASDHPEHVLPAAGAGDTLSVLQNPIDLGFHYRGWLRHPCEEIALVQKSIDLQVFDIYPETRCEGNLAVVSGYYDSLLRKAITVAGYSSNLIEISPPAPDCVRFFMYKIFREDEADMIDMFETDEPGRYETYFPYLKGVSMTALPGDSLYPGTIYAACAINYAEPGGINDKGHYHSADIGVYRYEPATSSWVRIAHMVDPTNPSLPHPDYYRTSFNARPANDILDVTIAANDEHVWVFWYEEWSEDRPLEPYGMWRRIMGHRIPDAATRTTVFNIPEGAALIREWKWSATESLQQIYLLDSPNVLDSTFDTYALENGVTGIPRIIWFEQDYNEIRRIQTGRIRLLMGLLDIDGANPLQQRQDFNYGEFYSPSIAANDFNRTLFTHEAPEAFTCWNRRDVTPNVIVSSLDIVAGGQTDIWSTEVPLLSNPVLPPDMSEVTYRGFGTRRVSWKDIVDTTRRIMTNTELLATGLYGYNFTDICTNRMNQKDVYTVYSYKEETQAPKDNRVMIVGIDP